MKTFLAAFYIGFLGLLIILKIENEITWVWFTILTFVTLFLVTGLIIRLILEKDKKLEKNNDSILLVMKRKAIMKDWSKIKKSQLN